MIAFTREYPESITLPSKSFDGGHLLVVSNQVVVSNQGEGLRIQCEVQAPAQDLSWTRIR